MIESFFQVNFDSYLEPISNSYFLSKLVEAWDRTMNNLSIYFFSLFVTKRPKQWRKQSGVLNPEHTLPQAELRKIAPLTCGA
jgi:hypothetical protein